MTHFKKSIIEVKDEQNCLAHALIIALARLNNDPNYNSYRQEYNLSPKVDHLLRTTGIDLTDGGGITELTQFHEHLKKIIALSSTEDCVARIFSLTAGRSKVKKRNSSALRQHDTSISRDYEYNSGDGKTAYL
jgi:hypothetical protein